jgi:hypothetical protein
MLEQFFWTIKTWTWSSSAFKKLFSVFFRNKVTRLVFEIFAQNVAQFIFGQNNKKLGYFFHYQKNPETNHPMGENSPNLVTLFRNKRCFSKMSRFAFKCNFWSGLLFACQRRIQFKGTISAMWCHTFEVDIIVMARQPTHKHMYVCNMEEVFQKKQCQSNFKNLHMYYVSSLYTQCTQVCTQHEWLILFI